MKRIYLFVLPILLAVFPLKLSGQTEENVINRQFWVDYNPRLVVSPKVILYGSTGLRTVYPRDWNRTYFIGGINFKPFLNRSEWKDIFQEMQLHAGLGDYFTQSIHDVNLNEFRLYQGLRFFWPNRTRIRFSHYIKFEQRFEKLVYGQEVSEFSARTRYKLQTRIGFSKPALQYLYFPLHTELFFDLGKGIYFNDLIRLSPGIGYDFSDQFYTEFLMMYNFSRNDLDESFQNENLIFRFRVVHII